MPEDDGEKNWWERNVEDNTAYLLDEERRDLPEDQLLKHDIEVGALKGLYGGGKSLVTGLFDVGVFGVKVLRGDQATYEKIWDVTKKVAKEGYTGTFGTVEEKSKQNERAHAAIKEIASSVKDKMQHDWDRAKKEGKTAELISHWTTRGVFEVATLVVGAGEVKAAAKVGEVSKLAKAGEVASIVTKCPKLAEAAEIEKAVAAEKALAESDVARGITRNKAGKATGAPKFADLSPGAKRLARQFEPAAEMKYGQFDKNLQRIKVGNGVKIEDLRAASEFHAREMAIVRDAETGELFAVMGDEEAILKGHLKRGDQTLIHTHPVYKTERKHFDLDIKNATERTEAVIDWKGEVTYFNKTGVIASPTSAQIEEVMNALGFVGGGI